MPPCVRTDETAVLAPIAIEALPGQRAQVRHGLPALPAYRQGPGLAVPGFQCPERRLDAVGHLSAVAAGAAGAHRPGLEHLGRGAGGGGFSRRGNPV